MRKGSVFVGMKHGRLTVLREVERDRSSIRRFECLCECGKTAVLRSNHFTASRRFCSRSCSLLSEFRAPDISGRRFGRWMVVRRAGAKWIGNRKRIVWLCRCDCGKSRKVMGSLLRSGESQSCGCLCRDNRSTGRTPEEEIAIRRERSRLCARKNPARVKANKIKYETKREQATPAWLTDDDWSEMNALYERARELTRKTGVPHQVDHILPIDGQTVSGLHVPANLQVLTQADNVSKSNIYADLSGD